MVKMIVPSFNNLDKDVEKYLILNGKYRKLRSGMMEFRGYYKAQELFFNLYLENEAYDPLISNLRYHWNWEIGDNQYLEDITEKLLLSKDWQRLKKLWGTVLSKRRKLYNKMYDLNREDPKTIPIKDFDQAKKLLVSTLDRLSSMAGHCGAQDEADHYSRVLGKIEKGKKG